MLPPQDCGTFDNLFGLRRVQGSDFVNGRFWTRGEVGEIS